MRIIEFLMGNIYFVIILIGLIYTMFFRKSPLEGPPQQRPPQQPGGTPPGRPAGRMPDFGGSPVFPPQQRPIAPADRRDRQPVGRREPRPEYAGPPRVEQREPRPEYAGRPPVVHPEYAEPPAVREPRPEWAPSPVMESRPVQVSRSNIPETPSVVQAFGPSSLPERPSTPDRLRPEAGETQYAALETRNVLTRDDLARAVLWAEILGPPRARRPFRR